MSSSRYEAVLFDMDGVVIDTHMEVTAFWQRLADASGVTLTPEDFTQFIYGRKAAYTLEMLFPQVTPAQWQAALADLEAQEAVARYRPLPGVLDTLAALNRAGVPIALVTSAPPSKVNVVLDQLGLTRSFAAQVTSHDVGQGKPHPECYQLGARRLGIAPERCIVFEDSLSGAQAAISAGATCIGVNPIAEPLLHIGAAHVIPDFQGVFLQTGPQGTTLYCPADYPVRFA